MAELLTAREVQELFQVDRSTIYRMAEDGRLPAMKVGRQWRFPAEQIHSWFQAQIAPMAVSTNHLPPQNEPGNGQQELAELLSWDWLKIIQTTFADLLGVMIVVTDIHGKPIIQPVNPCGLFTAVSDQPGAMGKFSESWSHLTTTVDLTPSFRRSHLGLLCARSMIAVGKELKGMVIAGCVAPAEWPPSSTEIDKIAARFAIAEDYFRHHVNDVYFLDGTQKTKVLSTLPRIATLITYAALPC